MDSGRFDNLARRWGQVVTRRSVLAGLVGLAGVAVGVDDSEAANRTCRLLTHKCVKNQQCCTGFCDRRGSTPRVRRNRCVCPDDRTVCVQDCCTSDETCIDDICCPAGTTLTCNGACCAEGEICKDGQCFFPCAQVEPDNLGCQWDTNYDEIQYCESYETAGICGFNEECAEKLINYQVPCGTPGVACLCQLGIQFSSVLANGRRVNNGSSGACEAVYVLVDGVCPA